MRSHLLSGSLIDSITKEEFLKVYNTNPPNKWTKFAFKYFSQSTLEKDRWLKISAQMVLFSLFALGFVSVAFNLGRIFEIITIIPFGVILVSIGVLMFGAFIMNNLRIKRICKKLGISNMEYELLVKYYL